MVSRPVDKVGDRGEVIPVDTLVLSCSHAVAKY